MDATKPYRLNPELAEFLKEVAAADRSLLVTIDERTYRLSVTLEHDTETADLWADYDPEQVRAAVRRSAAMDSRAELAELDPLIADIRAQRDQTSNHSDA